MSNDFMNGWTPFPDSQDDAKKVHEVPDTPQTRSPSYRLAYMDENFMMLPEMRSVRLGLELSKADVILKKYDIKSTVVLFGGARIPEPGKEAKAGKNDIQKKNLEKFSYYYDEARKFARLCAEFSKKTQSHEFVIVTGGGPGIMEAGNRGAADVDAPTIGLNIVLEHEQCPNPYITPELCFNFHYFAMRKMHFLMRAKALAIFPGGFGTMDELFEALTLIQTKKMKRIPVLMFGREFWKNVINIDYLAEMGTVSPDDVKLLTFVDSAEEGWNVLRDFYRLS